MPNSILIVDDSEDTRELFKATLEAEGFSVVDAGDGRQALEILRKNNDFLLILLDLSMPNMGGMQLLEEMGRQGLGRGVPVMLVSAAKNLSTMETPPNVIDTLKKPFFYPELIYKIRQLHGLQPERTEAYV